MNILNYKKPGLWVVVLCCVVVAAAFVALMSNSAQAQLTEKDFAEQFVEQTVADFQKNEWTDVQIVDSTITTFEKIGEFDELLPTPVGIWRLEYRLKPDDPSKVILPGGMNAVDGLITEDGSRGKPILVFSYKDAAPQYLGEIWSGDNDMTTSAGQEMALRVFMEEKGQLPHETYSGNHILVKFPLSSGETSQLLLSQPVVQGEAGIWCVERWKDTGGNVYYNTPWTDVAIAEHYERMQTQAEQGEDPSLLDPVQVALNYIKNDLGQKVSADQLAVDYSATADDFAVTPESTLLGYISSLSMENHFFDFDNVEWLTEQDSGRLKNLKIDPDELTDGYYILNKYTYTDPYTVTEATKYTLVNEENLALPKTVSKQEFIEHFKQYPESGPLCTITTQDGVVTSIAEKYMP